MSTRGEPSFLDRIAAALSALVPFGFALMRMPGVSSWQGDLPLVRGLGFIGTAGTGGATTLLVQLASLLPVGPRAFRASLVSAIALGLSGLVLHALAKRLLLANVTTPRLAPILATIAALTATLSPLLQQEASVTGGATVALLLGLTALLVQAGGPIDRRSWLVLGGLTGALFVESAPLALLLLAAIGALTLRPWPRRGPALHFAGGLLTTSLVLLLPWLLRPLAPRAAYDLGRTLGASELPIAAADGWLTRSSAIASWSSELGTLTLAIAALGLLVGMTRARLRAWILPLALILFVDALLPAGTRGPLSFDPLASIHLLALSALVIAAALGFQTAATMLLATRSTMGAAAAVLLVMFDVAGLATTMEMAALSVDRRAEGGAEAWTDEAFSRLPSRTVLLVRSQRMAFRLLAARLEEGARPDVLIVSSALLSEGRIAAKLLEAEPNLAGLLRDFSMAGRPGEASLTALADTRPLEVELDPGWDNRLVSHLVADRLWLRFAPQPLGRSDRERAFEEAQPRFEEVRAAASKDGAVDPASSAILAAQLRGQAASAGALGDRDAAFSLLERLAELSRDDPFITELSHRLGASKGGVSLEGLLP